MYNFIFYKKSYINTPHKMYQILPSKIHLAYFICISALKRIISDVLKLLFNISSLSTCFSFSSSINQDTNSGPIRISK